jgi:cytochrome c oxidase subunit 3
MVPAVVSVRHRRSLPSVRGRDLAKETGHDEAGRLSYGDLEDNPGGCWNSRTKHENRVATRIARRQAGVSETGGAAAARGNHRFPSPVLGMALLIASEVMFFGALFGAYYTLRAEAAVWPPPRSPELGLLTPAVLTVVLLSSSATQHLANEAVKRADHGATIRWLLVTVVLGLAFLTGEGFEWSRLLSEGFGVDSNVFGTLFFTMTGFHGLHLVAGLAILLTALTTALRRLEPYRKQGPMEAATYYWHFVDGVWIFLVTTLYVLNA